MADTPTSAEMDGRPRRLPDGSILLPYTRDMDDDGRMSTGGPEPVAPDDPRWATWDTYLTLLEADAPSEP